MKNIFELTGVCFLCKSFGNLLCKTNTSNFK